MTERLTPAELQRVMRRAERTKWEDAFAAQLVAHELPPPIRECRFHPERQWRFDFAWPHAALAVEIEGGVWSGGRHVRGRGFIEDCDKYNAAVQLGWSVLRFTPKQVKSGEALQVVKASLRD